MCKNVQLLRNKMSDLRELVNSINHRLGFLVADISVIDSPYRTARGLENDSIVLHGYWSEDSAELHYYVEGYVCYITKCIVYSRAFVFKEFDLDWRLQLTDV